jgi:hypothetical protein
MERMSRPLQKGKVIDMFRVVMVMLMLAVGAEKDGDLHYISPRGEEILIKEGEVNINTVPATVDDEFWKEVLYNEGN